MNTILFDLDGTILPMDLDKFLHSYFKNLAIHLKDYIDPSKLTGIMMECTNLMISNTSPIPNQDVFMSRFDELVNGDIEMYKEEFSNFYDNLFQEVKNTTWENKYIIESVKVLKEKGYNVVIATNPLFPMKANHHRIRWAGLTPIDFSYISSYEENSYCKPNIEFYKEVLSKINRDPKDCMMVGNDSFEDMIAGTLGIKTYLITDNLVNRYKEQITPDHIGTYKDFLAFVKTLKEVLL